MGDERLYIFLRAVKDDPDLPGGLKVFVSDEERTLTVRLTTDDGVFKYKCDNTDELINHIQTMIDDGDNPADAFWAVLNTHYKIEDPQP